jgi:hypothetical protein
MLKQPQAASETQNESLGRAHDEAPKLLTIARLICKRCGPHMAFPGLSMVDSPYGHGRDPGRDGGINTERTYDKS